VDNAVRQPKRLRVRAAIVCLAREMWLRQHDPYAGNVWGDNAWDEDALLSQIYEAYLAKAENLVREAMSHGE